MLFESFGFFFFIISDRYNFLSFLNLSSLITSNKSSITFIHLFLVGSSFISPVISNVELDNLTPHSHFSISTNARSYLSDFSINTLFLFNSLSFTIFRHLHLYLSIILLIVENCFYDQNIDFPREKWKTEQNIDTVGFLGCDILLTAGLKFFIKNHIKTARYLLVSSYLAVCLLILNCKQQKVLLFFRKFVFSSLQLYILVSSIYFSFYPIQLNLLCHFLYLILQLVPFLLSYLKEH